MDNTTITSIGAIQEGIAFVEVSGSCLWPDAIFPTLFAALSLMNSVVNNVANDYSTEMVDLTAGGLHDSREKYRRGNARLQCGEDPPPNLGRTTARPCGRGCACRRRFERFHHQGGTGVGNQGHRAPEEHRVRRQPENMLQGGIE